MAGGYADLDPAASQPGHPAHAEFGMPVNGVAKPACRAVPHAILVQRELSLPFNLRFRFWL